MILKEMMTRIYNRYKYALYPAGNVTFWYTYNAYDFAREGFNLAWIHIFYYCTGTMQFYR